MSDTRTGRTIDRELLVPASVEHSYQTVAYPDGWRTWLIADGEIESLPDGWLHLKWSIGAQVQVKVHERQQDKSVRMEWYAPSEPGRTTVVVEVSPAADGTRIQLTESGFGEGDAWDRCYEATNEVWDFALGQLQQALGNQTDVTPAE